MFESIAVGAARRQKSNRIATSLIEVIGTLAVLLVVAVSAASILGAITEIGARNNLTRQGRTSIERLAKVFRDDVHHASDVDLSNEEQLVALSTDGRTIRYQWDDQNRSIIRIVSDGETRRASEKFQLTDRCDPTVSADDTIVTFRLSDSTLTDGTVDGVNLDRGTGQHKPWIVEARQ